jgi:hypothetical protein
MSRSPDYGKRLREWLPAVWRERDNPRRDETGRVTREGDLTRLLEACGELLDAFHAGVVQRRADSFPDRPEATLSVADLKDAGALAARLRDPGEADLVARYLKARLSTSTLQALADWSPQDPPSPALQEALVADLNVVVGGGSIWSEHRFARIPLRMQTRIHQSANPTGAGLAHLNRLLLEDAHPQELWRIDGEHCQNWLLPYFARLLDVRLVSPDEAGRRAELRDAVTWRQRKGTRVSIERIAEAVGRFEVEMQEGWKRVAITPRMDRPLLPESTYGAEAIPTPATPDMRAGHPGLPAVTPDFRRCSRAVQCEPGNPGAHSTTFAATPPPLTWRQVHRPGIPGRPDSFQDVTRRTVDVRTPDWRRGLHHPRRVLLYSAPPDGLFARNPATVNWSSLVDAVEEALATEVADWNSDAEQTRPLGLVELTIRRGDWKGSPRVQISLRGLTPEPVRLRGVIEMDQPAMFRFENLWLDNRATFSHAPVQLLSCTARQLQVTLEETDAPVIDATACLFKKVEATAGVMRLEYVTVLDTLFAEVLQASDSILLPPLRQDSASNDVPAAGCVRFSRLFHLPPPPDAANPEFLNDPVWVAAGKRSGLRCHAASCTTVPALFWRETFGEPGCGVLHPDCEDAIRSGAEDGGELGAHHNHRYALRERAVLDKLGEFLPVGMEAVLIADESLSCPPPTATTTEPS